MTQLQVREMVAFAQLYLSILCRLRELVPSTEVEWDIPVLPGLLGLEHILSWLDPAVRIRHVVCPIVPRLTVMFVDKLPYFRFISEPCKLRPVRC